MIRADEKQALVAEVLDSDTWRNEMMPLMAKRAAYHRSLMASAVRSGSAVTAALHQGAIDGLTAYVSALYKFIKAEVPAWVYPLLNENPDPDKV